MKKKFLISTLILMMTASSVLLSACSSFNGMIPEDEDLTVEIDGSYDKGDSGVITGDYSTKEDSENSTKEESTDNEDSNKEESETSIYDETTEKDKDESESSSTDVSEGIGSENNFEDSEVSEESNEGATEERTEETTNDESVSKPSQEVEQTKPTEAPTTQKPTEKPTQKPTEAPTQKPTQPVTQPSTKPAEKETEAVTKPTEPETETQTKPGKEDPTKEVTGGSDKITFVTEIEKEHEHIFKLKEDKISDAYSYKTIVGTQYKCNFCNSIVDDCYLICPICEKGSIILENIEKEIFVPAEYACYEYCTSCGSTRNLIIVERDK